MRCIQVGPRVMAAVPRFSAATTARLMEPGPSGGGGASITSSSMGATRTSAAVSDDIELLWARARQLYVQGDFVGSDIEYARVIDVGRTKLPPGHPCMSRLLYERANCAYVAERFSDAEQLHRQALELRIRARPQSALGLAASFYAVARCLYSQEDYEAAREYFMQALAMLRSARGLQNPGHALTLTYLTDLIICLKTRAFQLRELAHQWSLTQPQQGMATAAAAGGGSSDSDGNSHGAQQTGGEGGDSGRELPGGSNSININNNAAQCYAEAEAVLREALGLCREAAEHSATMQLVGSEVMEALVHTLLVAGRGPEEEADEEVKHALEAELEHLSR